MIEVKAKKLYQAMKAVKHTHVNDVLPILNHALFYVGHGGAVLTAIDSSGNAVHSEPVHYWSNGDHFETCVPLVHTIIINRRKHKFYPFIDFLKIATEYDETLRIEYDSVWEQIIIRCGKSQTTFKCINSEEWPDGMRPPGQEPIKILKEDMKNE